MDNQQEQGGGVMDGLGGGSYGSPMYNFAGSIIEMTSSEELLFRLECNLSGVNVLSDGKTAKMGEALMNNKGVKDIMMVVKSVCDKAGVMSHYDTNEVKALMEYLNDCLARVLMLNKVNYGFTNPSGRDLVVFMCNNTSFAVIKRGFEGGERRFWKGSQIDYNIKGGNVGGEKRGIFGGIFKR